MTIVSRGYEGTIAPNVPWAEMNQAYGHEYVASHYDAGRVSIVTSGTRTVRVNAGPVVNGLRTGIGGHGVFDAITASEDITITDALPSTGQVKWYLIVAKRTWQTTQATSFVAITGTSTEALPSRSTTPGTVDDQPLALVQITGGQTVPTAVRDLRPVSRNGVYVVDPAARDLVMSYFNKVGYQLQVGSTTWTRVSSGGTLSWAQDAPPTAAYETFGSTVSGIAVPSASIPNVDGQLIVKSGKSNFFTTTAFGNEYGQTVNFAVPFPTACLGVSITQLQVAGGPTAFPGAVALDSVQRGSFRVFYPGGTTPTNRAFLYQAVGY